ncbi:MAG: hypothetical protein ACRDL0_09065 [Thermoleophilaceae bacterium]
MGTRLALEPPAVGCAELAGLSRDEVTELGELVVGSRRRRRARDDIAVYKSMGHVVEDMVAAEIAFGRARERQVGRMVAL